MNSGSIGGGIRSGAEGDGSAGIPLSVGLEFRFTAAGEEVVVVLRVGAAGKEFVPIALLLTEGAAAGLDAALGVVPAVGEDKLLPFAGRVVGELLLEKAPRLKMSSVDDVENGVPKFERCRGSSDAIGLLESGIKLTGGGRSRSKSSARDDEGNWLGDALGDELLVRFNSFDSTSELSISAPKAASSLTELASSLGCSASASWLFPRVLTLQYSQANNSMSNIPPADTQKAGRMKGWSRAER